MNPVYIKLGERKLIWARSKAKKGSGNCSGCLDQDPSSSPDPHQTSPLGTEEKRLEPVALLPPRPQPLLQRFWEWDRQRWVPCLDRLSNAWLH